MPIGTTGIRHSVRVSGRDDLRAKLSTGLIVVGAVVLLLALARGMWLTAIGMALLIGSQGFTLWTGRRGRT